MIIIRGMNKPENCERCMMSQLVGMVDSEDMTKSKKWIRCSVTKHSMVDYNLLKHEHPPLPDDCPIIEVEPFGAEGLMYKEKIHD